MNTSGRAENIRKEFRFLKGLMKKPRQVGAIAPTSESAARHIASLIPIQSGLPVVELGPGTGAMTKAILERGLPPERLVSIEFTADFLDPLKREYPGVNFIHGDAFDIENVLEDYTGQKFAGVIGAIPLLNFPMQSRKALVSRYLERVADNGPFAQICYGVRPPVQAVPGSFSAERSRWFFRNMPPVAIWVFRNESKSHFQSRKEESK